MLLPKPSRAFSCSSTQSLIALSCGSWENSWISQSSPVTASFLVCSWENKWVSFPSISSNSSICRKTSPSSASLKIVASFLGLSRFDGYVLDRS